MSIVARFLGVAFQIPFVRKAETLSFKTWDRARLTFALGACVAIGALHAALAMPTPWDWICCAGLIVTGVGMTREACRPGETLPGRAGASSRIPGRPADAPAQRRAAQDVFMQRIACLDSLHSVVRSVANPADLAPALARIGEQSTRLFDARSTHIFLPGPTASTIDEVHGFDRDAGPLSAARLAIPIERLPPIRRALTRRGAVSVGDPVLRQLALTVGAVPGLHNTKRLLIVPMIGRGGTMGAMVLGIDQPGRAFTADECRLAESIAADVAAAIENARQVEQARASAVAEERGRLARELHDSVTQSLYSIAIVAEALPRVLDREPGEARRNADYLRHTTLGALAEMRTLLFELRPSSLAAAKLSTLLHQQADALRGRTRIAVEVDIDGDADLPPDAKIGLYRIVQEVFNNIARHSQATRVVAGLRSSPSRIAITIADDGVGFEPGAAPADRMGLLIMRERAQAIDAHLLVASRPGQGTRVTIVWPPDQVGPVSPRPETNAATAPTPVVCDAHGAPHHLAAVPETALGELGAAL